jgi:hypothetical protein
MTRTRPRKTQLAREPRCGDYYHSEHRLFRVERASGTRVLVEDCGNGELFDIRVADLDELAPTYPQASSVRTKQAQCSAESGHGLESASVR